jgi:hypothetical protein
VGDHAYQRTTRRRSVEAKARARWATPSRPPRTLFSQSQSERSSKCPEERTQNLRCERDGLATDAIATVAKLGRRAACTVSRADAGLDLALGRVLVVDDAASAAIAFELPCTLDFDLGHLLQHALHS